MVNVFKRLFGVSAATPTSRTKSMIEAAYGVVDAYGEYCERLDFSGQILDEDALPFPKKAILNSLIIVASVEKDSEFRNAIFVCGPMLAYFQPNIGEALWPTGFNTGKVATFINTARDLSVDLKTETLMGIVEPDPNMQAQYEALSPRVGEEAEQIKGLLERAMAAGS